MPWKVSHVMNERMGFIVRLESGERMTDLCREYGISRKTGYKFWERYREYGPSGLFDESRRPDRLARRLPAELKEFIIQSKLIHPTWGAKKLRVELERARQGVRIPTVGTIHCWLDENGLVKKRKRRRPSWSGFYCNKDAKSENPNEVWCADFKGEFKMGSGKYCYPLTISDHYSRYLIGCEGLDRPTYYASRGVFEAAFRAYGLPKAIRTDNGQPFATSRGLLNLSRLSIWWLRLGIKIDRTERGHPEQNGRHERMHLTLKQETTRPAGANLLQQQERFDAFVDEYNNRRPHEALDMKCPADIYAQSTRQYSEELPELEYPLHDIVRVVSPGGTVPFVGKNKAFFLGSAFVGQKIGLRELKDDKWIVSFMNLNLGYVDAKNCRFETVV